MTGTGTGEMLIAMEAAEPCVDCEMLQRERDEAVGLLEDALRNLPPGRRVQYKIRAFLNRVKR